MPIETHMCVCPQPLKTVSRIDLIFHFRSFFFASIVFLRKFHKNGAYSLIIAGIK